MSKKNSRRRSSPRHHINDDIFMDDNEEIRTTSKNETLQKMFDYIKDNYDDIINITEFIDLLTMLYNETINDEMKNTIDEEKEALKKEIYEWFVEHSTFENVDELTSFIVSFTHLMNVLDNLSDYLRKYTFDDALSLLNEVDKYFDDYEDNSNKNYNDIFKDITYYMIANFYTDNRLSKNDFLQKHDNDLKQKQVNCINELIKGLIDNDTTSLRLLLNNYIDKANCAIKEQVTKKTQLILQNAYKKADKNNDNEKELYNIKDVATNKLNKLITPYSNDEAKHTIVAEIVDSALKDLDEYIDTYISQIRKQEEQAKAETEAIAKAKEHQEKNTNKATIQTPKEKVKKDIETKAKPIKEEKEIKQSSKNKNKTETPPITMKTSYESLYNKINNVKDTDNSKINIDYKEQHVYGNIIRIGKFELIKETEVDNPVDYDAIAMKLHQDDRNNLDGVEAIIDQYGLDKIKTYLNRTASNTLHLEQLERYLQLDRSLRYEYQKLMEDIEMYFSSTFSSYITNKYDRKYNILGTHNIYEYRGYLSKTLFIDSNEHYDAIKQLRDRIDLEITQNNEQITREFSKYKYSISFAAALGIMSFGWSVNMFNNLNSQDKAEYLNFYYKNLTSYTFNNWINNLLGFRNRLAHYKELYRLSSYDTLKTITTTYNDGNSYDDEFEHSTLFYYTIIIARLSPDVENIEDFIDNVGILFRKAERKNECFNLQDDYSFPKTWKLILENEKSTKVNVLQ